MKQLPTGANRDRLRLWDKQWRLMWDSATASTPAYQHICGPVLATIDYPDGSRWIGEFWRCPEGIKGHRIPSRDEITRFGVWRRLSGST